LPPRFDAAERSAEARLDLIDAIIEHYHAHDPARLVSLERTAAFSKTSLRNAIWNVGAYPHHHRLPGGPSAALQLIRDFVRVLFDGDYQIDGLDPSNQLTNLLPLLQRMGTASVSFHTPDGRPTMRIGNVTYTAIDVRPDPLAAKVREYIEEHGRPPKGDHPPKGIPRAEWRGAIERVVGSQRQSRVRRKPA
jgi:hypothetical protein